MRSKRNNVFLTLGISAVLTILIVFLLSKLFAIIMISPDDIGFEKILSGSTTGTPDGHAYFLRYPLGAALAFLYRLYNGISWYQLFLLGSLALSFFLIFMRVRHVAAGRRILYLLTTVLLVFLLFSENVVHLEWSVIAGVLGATAIFRFVTIPTDVCRWKSVFEYAVCAILLVFCFCLRHTVAYMFIPLAGLCWLRRLLNAWEKPKEEKKRTSIQLIVFLLVCVILVGSVMVIHKLAYSSEEWQAYQDYTKDRSALFDYYGYPDYETYAEEYQAAGISYEAYVLMRDDYNYIVPCDNFREMDLKAIANLAREIHTEDQEAKIESTYRTFRAILEGEEYLLLNVVIVVLITCNVFIYKDKKVIDILFIVAMVCWAVALSIYLAYDGRLPERVVRCIDYGLIMSLLGNCVVQWLDNPKHIQQKLLAPQKVISVMLAVVMLGTIVVNFSDLRETNARKEKLAIAYMELLRYCAGQPENLYLRDFWSFSQRGELFMNPVQCNNYVSTGGWTYHAPVYDELLKNWDCEDLYQAIQENKNIYYLVTENKYEQVSYNLNQYFAESDLPILTELVDVFETVNEKVFVIKFVHYSSVDLMESFVGAHDCQVTETEDGISVLTTGIDPQLHFSVPEMTEQVTHVLVEMDVKEPASLQLFTATADADYSEEQSRRAYFDDSVRKCLIENPGGQPISVRLDPTNVAGQEILLRSVELMLTN